MILNLGGKGVSHRVGRAGNALRYFDTTLFPATVGIHPTRKKPFNTKSVNRHRKRDSPSPISFQSPSHAVRPSDRPDSDASAHKQSFPIRRPSLTVPRRPSAPARQKHAVRSWSCHTRVNAKHEPRSTHPAAHRPLPQIPAARTHAPTAIFPSLLSPFPLLLVRTHEWHPRNRSPHTLTSLTPEHAPMCFLFPVHFVISSFHPPSLGSASG